MIGKANREILKPQIEIASKESSKLKNYERPQHQPKDLLTALQRCLDKGLTPAELSKRLGVSGPTVVRWLEKKNQPHPEMIPGLIKTLNTF